MSTTATPNHSKINQATLLVKLKEALHNKLFKGDQGLFCICSIQDIKWHGCI
jgi:hypothetical protein